MMHVLLLPFLLMSIADVPVASPDIAVVCPAEFRPAMQPWVERRTSQGHSVQFLSNLGTPVEIRERIRDLAKSGKLQYVVLVGEAPKTEGHADRAQRAKLTPTFRIPARILNVLAGIQEFDTDNPYADLNDDGVPELAIGRLSARSADELSAILKKIMAYEDSRDFGPWRARINFVTGQGGYGEWADTAIEATARSAVAYELPKAYQTTMTDAQWESPFCPDPHKFHTCALQRMNEGCLFWVFMGHGSPRTLQWAVFPDGSTPILQCDDCSRVNCGATPPIVLFFCCYTAALTNQDGCMADDLLRSANGPVAVIGGSSETFPYGMAALGREAIREYFVNRRETLGQWLLYAKRDAMAGYDLPIWSLVNAATVALAPAFVNPKAERLEHLQLFNLFGDPTMKLYHPRDVKLNVASAGIAGKKVTVEGECPIAGTATVELLMPLNQLRIPGRELYDDSVKGRAEFEATYEATNRSRLASTKAQVHDGHFSAELLLPDAAAGVCRVRVFVDGKSDCALGACDFAVVGADHSQAMLGPSSRK